MHRIVRARLRWWGLLATARVVVAVVVVEVVVKVRAVLVQEAMGTVVMEVEGVLVDLEEPGLVCWGLSCPWCRIRSWGRSGTRGLKAQPC